jgi:hypothetical protein
MKSLETVAEAFPFFGLELEHIEDKARVRTALDALRTARDVEAGGLGAI